MEIIKGQDVVDFGLDGAFLKQKQRKMKRCKNKECNKLLILKLDGTIGYCMECIGKAIIQEDMELMKKLSKR